MIWTPLTNALSDEHEQLPPIRQATVSTKGLVQVSEHERYQFNLVSKADYITVWSLMEIGYT